MKFKRFMGLVLAVLMIMSTFSFGTFAATYRDQETKKTETYYGTPTIDAQLDDVWESAVAVNFPYDRQNASESSIAEPLATTPNHWAKTLWDDNGFYVYFRVYDENVYTTTVASDVYIWDSVEIYFNEYNEKISGVGNMIFPCIAPTADGNGLSNKPTLCEFKTKINAEEGYYDIEVKIPFTKISPTNDAKIGFDVAINVNDSNTANRKASLSWNDRTNTSYKNTKYLGETVLKGKVGGTEVIRPEGATNLHDDGTLWYIIEDDVLTIGGTAKQFNFSGNLPWYWNETITKLVIEAPLTAIPAGAFKTMRTLKTVVMPESVTSFPGGGVFDGCWVLDTIALSEDAIEDGVMDLTKIKSMASWALGGIGANAEAITVLFGNDMDFSGYNSSRFLEGCSAITVKVTAETTAATTFAAFKENASNKDKITLELLDAGDAGDGGDDEVEDVPSVVRPEGAIDYHTDGTLWYIIEDDVLTIGGTATEIRVGSNMPWYWNETITKLVITAPLTYIASNAFKTMRTLKTVVMPASVESFGAGVFDGCWVLDTIALSEETIEEGVMDFTKFTAVTPYAFGGIGANATSITALFGDDVDFSGYNAGQFFQACPSVTVKVNAETTAATTFAAFKETASNKDKITLELLNAGEGGEGGEGGEEPVVRPADAIDLHDDGTLWYTIKDGVLTIGGTATEFRFSGNLPWFWDDASKNNITKLVIEAPLTAIPAGAFKAMRVLKTVVMPESVTNLAGGGIFDGCWVLDTIALSEDSIEAGVMDLTKITSMASWALGGIGANATAITVLFNDGMDFSGYNAGQFFQACPSVTVRLNVDTDAATSFVAFKENAANKDKIAIEWVVGGVVRPEDAIDLHSDGTLWYTIKDGVLTISGPATEFRFSGNLPWFWDDASKKNITKLVIEAPLKVIPSGAFKAMRVLKTVVMPESVTSFGAGVFDGCWILNTIALSEDSIKAGVMDLTKLEFMTPYALGGIGASAESITVLFGDDVDFSGYNAGQFFQSCPSVTVKVKKDTTAATTFAAFKETATNKDKIILDLITTARGDIDGNGEISISDAVLFAQHLAKWAVDIDKYAADTNGDGDITIADLVLLAQHLAKWEVKFG